MIRIKINLYKQFIFFLRSLFPKLVNCWFCNKNFRIKYEQINKWTCPDCGQYNGFNEDGDYNQEIPAQKCSRLNTHNNASFCEKSFISRYAENGFCTDCNRNQERKIQQLASFEPKFKNNYEDEIVEYK